MTAPFMRAYTELLVQTCHRRGAHAIGGMAAVVPSRDPVATERALNQVRAGQAARGRRRLRRLLGGPPGPGRRPAARCSTSGSATEPHQIVRKRDDVRVTAADLLDVAGASAVTVSEVGAADQRQRGAAVRRGLAGRHAARWRSTG